jgi:hypothetical protein
MDEGLKIILLLGLDGGLGTNPMTSMPSAEPVVGQVGAESRVYSMSPLTNTFTLHKGGLLKKNYLT